MLYSDSISGTSLYTTLPYKMETTPSLVFKFDSSQNPKFIKLTNDDLTVTFEGNKRWYSIKSTIPFYTGIHYWEVYIDRCLHKNIFIGVVTSEGSLSNYIGYDEYGWGFIGSQTIWHCRSKLMKCKEGFGTGDRIGVTLDMNERTLSFSK